MTALIKKDWTFLGTKKALKAIHDNLKIREKKDCLVQSTVFSECGNKCWQKISSLIKRHFPTCHKLAKLFSENIITVSNTCMRNINSDIATHERQVLNPKTKLNHGCNKRMEENCPLDNKCLTPSVINYGNNDKKMTYIGLTNLNNDTPTIAKTLSTENM